MYVHLLPIDDRTPEGREDDHQRYMATLRDLVDEMSLRERLARVSRGR